MDLLKLNFAKKLQALRAEAGMTQSELGEQLNYSDKTVSKWERGEALPDAVVLKKLSRLFGVTVDFLLDDGEAAPSQQAAAPVEAKAVRFSNYPAITRVILTAIWTAALTLFVILWILLDLHYWMIFIYAMPITAVTMLVFNSVWNRGRGNFWLVSALVLSTLATVYLGVLSLKNTWQLFLLALPAELLVFLSFRIKKRRK